MPPSSFITPEEEAKTRIEKLENKHKTIKTEIAILEGQLKNRDPEILKSLQRESEVLLKRLPLLQKIFYLLIEDGQKIRHKEEIKFQIASLREATIQYCKQADISEELWQGILS